MLNNLIPKYIRPIYPLPTSLHQSGELKEKIKCILFDVYGTLFISRSGDISIAKRESQQTEKLKKLLHKFGISKNPQTILKELFNAIEKKHQELKKQGIDFPEVEIDKIWMQILEYNNLDKIRELAVEFELIVNPVYPMPNMKEMLSRCKDLNILMGIISNAQFYTPYLFSWFLESSSEDLGFHPELILYSYKYGYAKPSTFMFQVAAERLKNRDIPAHAALYIGNDMLNDIYPSKKAGFKTALFAGDNRSLRLRKGDPKCSNLSADLVITDLIQIVNYLG